MWHAVRGPLMWHAGPHFQFSGHFHLVTGYYMWSTLSLFPQHSESPTELRSQAPVSDSASSARPGPGFERTIMSGGGPCPPRRRGPTDCRPSAMVTVGTEGLCRVHTTVCTHAPGPARAPRPVEGRSMPGLIRTPRPSANSESERAEFEFSLVLSSSQGPQCYWPGQSGCTVTAV
jgi:hypothetical protein